MMMMMEGKEQDELKEEFLVIIMLMNKAKHWLVIYVWCT